MRPHSKTDTIEMAQAAIAEIEMLRSVNRNLVSKADAYDMLTAVLRLLPQPSQSMGEDMAWKLKRRVEELKADGGA